MLNIGGSPEVIELGTGNKDTYQSMYKFHEETYGENNVLKSFLNGESTDKEPFIKVPKPVISEDISENLNPKTPSNIYYDNDSDRTPASLLTQSLFNRPVRTITDIDEVLEKIDTVDSVKDLKNFKSKITKGIRKIYKEETGDNKILNLNDLSLEDYRKYLTMYRSQFIDDNQDLFKESKPKSLLAGN